MRHQAKRRSPEHPKAAVDLNYLKARIEEERASGDPIPEFLIKCPVPSSVGNVGRTDVVS